MLSGSAVQAARFQVRGIHYFNQFQRKLVPANCLITRHKTSRGVDYGISKLSRADWIQGDLRGQSNDSWSVGADRVLSAVWFECSLNKEAKPKHSLASSDYVGYCACAGSVSWKKTITLCCEMTSKSYIGSSVFMEQNECTKLEAFSMWVLM